MIQGLSVLDSSSGNHLVDGRTDGPTDRRTDRPTDRQTDGPTDRRTDRPTDRQTDGPTDRRTDIDVKPHQKMEIVSNFHEHQEDNVTCRKAQNIIGTNIVTKILEDRKINVTSRVLTMKNAPPPGSHVFQPIVTIFELIQDIIETYILAKFYKDWNINAQTIIGTNIVTKILEDRKINVTSRVKNAPPPGSHVFQPIVTIFELIQDIIETYILAKFYEDWNINVASNILESIKLLQPKHLSNAF
ncbi:hypothetical protein DPMN_029140 [Dreissena polymorpha]|uniref:Uncharacterized protein n=1 Tax=Dreissena polymorpha TaxID=45954 RepID=A0A9D4LYK6_DREPO|nr:hypothetical protein DPMN_029140 [Dreissena polymorpha]